MSVERELRKLGRTQAPAGLFRRVMAAVGAPDSYAEVETELGRVFLAWSEEGISAVYQARSPEVFERWFASAIGRPLRRVEAVPAGLLRRPRFDLRGLTPFERAVLEKALEIPRGEVRPYGWIAREIGRPLAVRAVGTALAHNPIPILIPCHRVVRSDGMIGNYSLGGRENKLRILREEGVDPEELERLARAGVRFWGSRTTRIFCHPSCHNARRIEERNRVEFRSGVEAAAAGYRACRVCRPAPEAAAAV